MVVKKLLHVALILGLSLGLSNCASKKKRGAMGEMEGYSEKAELYGDSDSKKAGLLRTVFFPFDSSMITGDTAMDLKENATYLMDNTSINVQIEGHCDERGSVQYNLALGERRAKAVKDYLVALGVKSSRITIISYGKERALEYGHSESSWSRNRRGNFVITSK